MHVMSFAVFYRFHFTYPNVKVCGGHLRTLTEELIFAEFKDDTSSPEYNSRKLQIYEDLLKKSDAFTAAKNLLNDGVILPKDTRAVLSSCLSIFKHNEIMKAVINPPQQAIIRM